MGWGFILSPDFGLTRQDALVDITQRNLRAADNLFPRWLLALTEMPGSQIETLNRAERLDVLTSKERWLKVRNIRNRLVHEYMTDPVKFALDFVLAKKYSLMLIETFNRLRQYAMTRMGHNKEIPSEELTLLGQSKGTYYEEN